jgi:hypothetical protein
MTARKLKVDEGHYCQGFTGNARINCFHPDTPPTCSKVADYQLGDKFFCIRHAADAALQILLELEALIEKAAPDV